MACLFLSTVLFLEPRQWIWVLMNYYDGEEHITLQIQTLGYRWCGVYKYLTICTVFV